MVATRAGMLGGEEAVEVHFAPSVLPFEKLLAHAERRNCARTVYVTSDAQMRLARERVGDRALRAPGAIQRDSEPKYYLFTSLLRSIPMPEVQAMHVNAGLGSRDVAGAEALLSPRQKALLAAIRAHPAAKWPNVVGRDDLRAAWAEADAARAAAEKR